MFCHHLAKSEEIIIIKDSSTTVASSEEDVDSDDEDVEVLESPPVDIKKAKQGWALVQHYFEQYAEPEEMETVNKVNELLHKKRLQGLRQENIIDFFR